MQATENEQGTHRDLHQEAQNWRDKAAVANIRGIEELVHKYLGKALELEKQACSAVSPSQEPLRSKYYLAAAEYALGCDLLPECAQLARAGLSDKTPPEIKHELEWIFLEIERIEKGQRET